MLFRLNGAQLRPFNDKTTTLYTDSETALTPLMPAFWIPTCWYSDNGSGTCTVLVQATFLGIGVGPSTVIDTFSC